MNPTSLIDTRKLCIEAIVKEMELFNSEKSFNHSACRNDSRDTDFNKLKSRLAYTYNFGCYIAKLVEKCLTNFLTDYSESESTFPLENLKVCSLSNGPGLDIIGLFCALFNSNKRLKCFPRLEAINLYHLWLSMYKNIVQSGHEIASTYFYPEYCSIPSENINLIQSDLYADLSAEAVNCISDCNVLLMVNTFVSNKAHIGIFKKTLKKVFLLLKPGTLIFFIGTKNNKKNFLKLLSLSKYVKCIYGPQKVTLENIGENFQKIKNKIPKDIEFIVWLKRDVVSKNNATGGTSDDGSTDVESKISSTSCSKHSDSSCDEFENNSSEKVFNPDEETQNLAHTDNSLADSMNDISSLLDEMNLENSNDKNIWKYWLSNTSKANDNNSNYFKNDIQEIEIEAAILTEEIASPTLQKVISEVEIPNQLKNVEITEKGISCNVVPQFTEDSILSNNTDLSYSVTANENQSISFPPIIENKMSNEDDKNTPSKSTPKKKKKSAKVTPSTLEILDEMGLKNSNCEKNLKCLQPYISKSVSDNQSNLKNDVQKIELRAGILTEEIASPTLQKVNSKVENSKQLKNVEITEKGISCNVVPQFTEDVILSNYTDLSFSVTANENQSISFPPIIENKMFNEDDKNAPSKSTPKKKKKKSAKVTPLTLEILDEIDNVVSPLTEARNFSNTTDLINSINANENQSTPFPPVIENKMFNQDDKNTDKSAPEKKKKKKVLPSTFDKIENVTEVSVPQNSLYTNQSSEKQRNFSTDETVQENYAKCLNDKNNNDLSALIQRCESLVSSLENITANIKNSMSSKKHASIAQKQSCVRGTCAKLGVPYSCACFFGTMCMCCCRRTCN